MAILAHKLEPRGVTKRRNAVAVAIYLTFTLLLRRYRLAIATQPLPIDATKVIREAFFKRVGVARYLVCSRCCDLATSNRRNNIRLISCLAEQRFEYRQRRRTGRLSGLARC
jgi:hypothetical protein